MSGYGTLTYQNGEKYDGLWKADKVLRDSQPMNHTCQMSFKPCAPSTVLDCKQEVKALAVLKCSRCMAKAPWSTLTVISS